MVFTKVRLKNKNDIRNFIQRLQLRSSAFIRRACKTSRCRKKTAGVVLSNAFGHPAIPVDTHVFRIVNRIGIVETSTPEKQNLNL